MQCSPPWHSIEMQQTRALQEGSIPSASLQQRAGSCPILEAEVGALVRESCRLGRWSWAWGCVFLQSCPCSIRNAGEAAGVLSPVHPVGRCHEASVTSRRKKSSL